MSYGHAHELALGKTPHEKLAFLVQELRRWAALNPALVPLFEEFKLVENELKPR